MHVLHVAVKDNKMAEIKEVDEHQSYGMVSLSHVSSNGIPLFGSGVKHNNFVELKIKHAVRKKDAYHDHYFSKDRIVSVYLSPAQFTGMLTRTNTPGVPCTINWLTGDGYIDPPEERNIKTELYDDLKEQFKNLSDRVKELKDEIDADLKGPVNKAAKEKIKFNVMKIHQDLNANLTFLMRCQSTKLEDLGTQIVTEAEATVNGIIKQAGLEAIQEENKRLEFKNANQPKIKRIIKRIS